MHCYNFSTAKEQSNCYYANKTNKKLPVEKKRLEMSAGATAGLYTSGFIALIVVMAIAGFIMVSVPMHALRDERFVPSNTTVQMLHCSQIS